jgi:hypothetical protein
MLISERTQGGIAMLKRLTKVLQLSLFVMAGLLPAWAPPALAQVNFSFGVEVGPPPRHVEVLPPPRAGFVWAPGYWGWDGAAYAWVPGRWVESRPGYYWVPERWEEHAGERGRHWHFAPGRWEAEHGRWEHDRGRGEHEREYEHERGDRGRGRR